MIKVLEQFETKVNFVDDQNVFVGYDLRQDCCEWASWVIAEARELKVSPPDAETELSPDLSSYRFDPSFFETSEPGWVDEGGIATFRLVSDSLPDLYLHIFNAHNGYYGHGFEFGVEGGDVLQEEVL